MRRRHPLARTLLCIHLFVCVVWLYLFQASASPPAWMIHVFLWSVLAIQFTWGLTVGLLVGPSRRTRGRLWWSLLTLPMPLWFLANVFKALWVAVGPLAASVYLTLFVAILACETFGGVVLGCRLRGGSGD